jgi:hypothetical protein
MLPCCAFGLCLPNQTFAIFTIQINQTTEAERGRFIDLYDQICIPYQVIINHHRHFIVHLMFALPYLILLLHVQLSFCLWPIPRLLQSGSTPLKLSTNFNINVDINNAPKDLLAAVARSKSHIHNDKHHRLVVGHETSDQLAIVRANSLSTLSITLEKGAHARKIAEESVQEIGTRVESYHLIVPSDGSPAILTANSTLGLFRGLTTFEQLWYHLQGTIYTLEAPLEIYDSPAFVSSYYGAILCRTNDTILIALPWVHA